MYYCRYSQRQITTVEQLRGEPLLNYLNHFDDLLKKFPDHGLTNYDVLNSFLRGMDPTWYRRLRDAAEGQWLEDMYLKDAWDLIEDVAGITRTSNQQQSLAPPEDTEHEYEEEIMREIMWELKEIKNDIKGIKQKQNQIDDRLSMVEQTLNKGKLPSQTIPNPRSTVNDVTLRSGKEVQGAKVRIENSTSESSAATTEFMSADLQNSPISADRNSSQSAGAYDPGMKNLSSEIQLPFSLQVVETEGEEAESLDSRVGTRVSNQVMIVIDVAGNYEAYTKELTARANKKIPENMSRKSLRYENRGQELDWQTTVRMLPYKRCQRKRYVAIQKFDHTYPWEPGL